MDRPLNKYLLNKYVLVLLAFGDTYKRCMCFFLTNSYIYIYMYLVTRKVDLFLNENSNKLIDVMDKITKSCVDLILDL